MNLTRNRIHSIGWAFVLSMCLALSVALTLRVNAVKGQVRESESKIVSLERDIQFLDVEFQTRANQHQLAALNAVEFGYTAPGAGQYIEGERQLAALGMPRAPGAPQPIRMVNAQRGEEQPPLIAMVSPVGPAHGAQGVRPDRDTGRDSGKVAPADDTIGAAIAEAKLGTRLARIDLAQGPDE